MCFGNNNPAPPQIIYQGPSEDDIERNQAALDDYAASIQASQEVFQTQLQAQIDEANAATAALEERYADDLNTAETNAATVVSSATNAAQGAVNSATGAAAQAVDGATGQAAADISAASAQGQAQYNQALTTTVSQTEPELPQTTNSSKKKKDPKKSLKISTGGAAASSGVGANLGI